MKDKRSTDEIKLLKDKFDYAKEVLTLGKDIETERITSTYKPYEETLAAQSTSVAQAAGYEATDQYRMERYVQSTPDERKTMLMGIL